VKKPYALTGGVFLVMAIFGIWYLQWGEVALSFLLLLFFIVILGIRLDDISRQIEITNSRLSKIVNQNSRSLPGETPPNHHLSRTETTLESINRNLEDIRRELKER
jgi:hypothetical protein